uniref:Uncharacterized protein n=1 Tax=Aegilops tauschii subsp. strangulata TaxID=200361 RepID=A0A453LE89_AEGTS
MLDRRRACRRHGVKECWALLGGSRSLHLVKMVRSADSHVYPPSVIIFYQSRKSINRWLQTYNDNPNRNRKSNRSSCQPFAQHWEPLPPDRRHPTTWRRDYKKASPSLLQYRPLYNYHHFRIQITPSLPNSKQEAIAQRPSQAAARQPTAAQETKKRPCQGGETEAEQARLLHLPLLDPERGHRHPPRAPGGRRPPPWNSGCVPVSSGR